MDRRHKYRVILTKHNIIYMIIFAVFLYTYMILLSVMDNVISSFTGHDILHYLPTFTRVLGYVSFYLSRRFISSEKHRKSILFIVNTLFIVSAACSILRLNDAVTVISLFLLAFTTGHLGGLIHYIVASYLSGSFCSGRIIACASSLAILAQFLVSKRVGAIGNLITAAVFFSLLVYISMRPPADFVLDNPLPYTDYTPVWVRNVRKQLRAAIIFLFLTTLLAIRIDMIFVNMQFSSDISLYVYPRLFMIPGFLILGISADSRIRYAFPSVLYGGVLLIFILSLLPYINSDFVVFLCIYYIYVSFYTFFFTYVFIHLAAESSAPEIWASSGRAISELFTFSLAQLMFMLQAKGVIDSIPPLWSSLITTVLVFILYLILTHNSFTIISGDEFDVPLLPGHNDPDLSDSEKDAEAYIAFLAEFPLTPREKDVAKYLLTTDYTMKAIADELGISERSVYRYSAGVYEKTATYDRVGLVKAFMSR